MNGKEMNGKEMNGKEMNGKDTSHGDALGHDRDGLAHDVLLSRAVAGDRAALDEVRALSAVHPALIEELALWQADELRLARAARTLDAVADATGIPDRRADRTATASGRLGWFVAAMLAVALLARPWSGDGARGNEKGAQIAGFGMPSFASSDEAFKAYLAKAREEGAMVSDPEPPVYLGSRELGDGSGFEVVVVRQIYEIRRTPQMYRMQQIDESGRVQPVLIRPRTETLR